MAKCDNHRCPICYPNWKEEEAAAKKRADDDKRDCIDCWRFYQKEAEAIVSVDDPVSRNRRINAAYAQLWLDDHRFQWAGLAAFASKQVGCGLLNAAELISKSNRERNAHQQWERQSAPLERMAPYGSPRMPIPDQANGAGAEKVYQMLANGNTALFLDVWPLHMFYKKFGYSGSSGACRNGNSCAGPSSGRSTTVCVSESRDPKSRRGLPQSIAAISQWVSKFSPSMSR